MISMFVGWPEEGQVIDDADVIFNTIYKSEWLEDPFIIEMIRDIDNSVVVASDVLRNIDRNKTYPPQRLCGGTKMMILMYKWNRGDRIFDLSWCGSNCAKYVQEIAAKQDIRVFHTNVFWFSENYPFKLKFENNGKVVDTTEEFFDEFYELREDLREREAVDYAEE